MDTAHLRHLKGKAIKRVQQRFDFFSNYNYQITTHILNNYPNLKSFWLFVVAVKSVYRADETLGFVSLVESNRQKTKNVDIHSFLLDVKH